LDAPAHPYTRALLSAVPVPNPRRQRERERIILRGEVPDAVNPPSGCAFHTRCPLVMDVCRVEAPRSSRPRAAAPPAATCTPDLRLRRS
jgi:peptide/nickel transport system ATP-binding protein